MENYTIDELLDIGDRADYRDACMAGVISNDIMAAVTDAKAMRSALAVAYSVSLIESEMIERMDKRQFDEYMNEGKPTRNQIQSWMNDHPIGCLEFMATS